MKKFLRKSNFLTYLILIIASIIIIYPLLITIMSAFTSGNVVAFKLNLHSQWTLENFKRLFTESMYGKWYINTLIIAIGTMLFQVVTVTLSGYVYSRHSFIGKKQSLIFFLVVQMIPTMSALTAFYVMALLTNGLDQYWFLTLIYIGGGIPMNTWLMKGYFDTVPVSLDESAKLDGAGNFRIFAQIVLPLVKPMVAVQALWAFMTPFGDYMLSKFLLRSPDKMTVAVGLQTFINDTRNQRVTLFAAGAILVALPISALFFYLQKYFVAGLSNGSVKG